MAEKSEQEKIAICKRFLEKRGFIVERMLKAAQLAELLGCSTTHVYSLDIPHINIGRGLGGNMRRRYSARDVAAWIEQRQKEEV